MVSAIEGTRAESASAKAPAASKAPSASETAASGLFALLMAHLQGIAEAAVEQGNATAGDVATDAPVDGQVETELSDAEKAAAELGGAFLVLPQAAIAATVPAETATDAAAEALANAAGQPLGAATIAVVDVSSAGQQASQAAAQVQTSSATYVVTPPVATPEPEQEGESDAPAKEVSVSDAGLGDLPEPVATQTKPVLDIQVKESSEKALAPKQALPGVDVAQAQAKANAEADDTGTEFRETKPLAASELLKQALGSSGVRLESTEEAHAGTAEKAAMGAAQRVDVSTGVQPSVEVGEAKNAGMTAKVDVPQQAERPTLQTLQEFTARGVRYLVREGGDTVTVRLVPESLGEVRFDVMRTQDTVSVRLVSGNPTVRSVLESQVHGLRDQLTQDGFTVSQIVVTADAASSNSQSGHFGSSWSDQAPAWRGGDAASTANSSRNQTYETPVRRSAVHNGALDVFV